MGRHLSLGPPLSPSVEIDRRSAGNGPTFEFRFRPTFQPISRNRLPLGRCECLRCERLSISGKTSVFNFKNTKKGGKARGLEVKASKGKLKLRDEGPKIKMGITI